MSKSIRWFWFLLVAAALAGCASLSAPEGAPAPALPVAFSGTAPGLEAGSGPDGAEAWWARFGDPALSGLVDRALEGNRDVAESVARLDAARAARSLARWGFAPGGAARGAWQERQASEAEAPGDAGARRTQLAAAGLDASWEIDLFGRVRSLARAADARLMGSAALLDQVRRVTAAEVVRTYFEARGAEERAALLGRFATDQEEIVALERIRVEAGLVPDDAVARAEAELAAQRAARVAERDRLGALENALAVLVGETPGAFRLPVAPELGELRLEPVALGDPVTLVSRRPDVAAAEAELRAQQAEIGAATAELFPQLRLSGVFGFVAGSGGDLGGSSARSWSAGPTLSWGIFDLGRVRARIGVERAESRAALVAWERAVLRALEEAENAFRGFASAQEALALRLDQRRHAAVAADAALARFEAGATPYLDALLARRDALAAELARVDALIGHRTATVAVFKALGGSV